jgi:tetratricopeptide (TPR) repeat protein
MADHWSLIAGNSDDPLATKIQDGQYLQILKESPLFADITTLDATLAQTGDLAEFVSNQIRAVNATDMELLVAGIAALNVFIQVNWTGPLVDLEPHHLVAASEPDAIQKFALTYLSADSEEVYHLAPHLGFLVIALTIFRVLSEKASLESAPWWYARAVFTQQKLLDEGANSLREIMVQLYQRVLECIPKENSELLTRCHLEVGLVHHWYGMDKEAYEEFQVSQACSGFSWNVTGAMGRRTKHQQFDVSQLVIVAESKKRNEDGESDKIHPETLALNDDTLLEKIALNDDESAGKQGNLQVIDQCLLLAYCSNVKNTNPDHGITAEQMKPYVSRVLDNPNNWMVYTMALLLRSRLESNKSRTVERSVLQLQALVDQIKVEDSTVQERLAYFYQILIPSKWEMERELAKRFISLGVLRSALEIFERLQLWEDVISTYQMLDQPEKAKKTLLSLLEEQPKSPKLWCILGDIEQNPEHWHKAWEISGRPFARAMRSLGAYHYRREEFKESIESYENAMKLNPLFENSWFIMGCAAIQISEWDTGVRAFGRAVGLDAENAEGWNNLASIYIRQDKKGDAFYALKQATKLKFENWKMWQNLLYVCIDIGEFAEAILAMQRIVDIRWEKVRDQAVDTDVLSLIIDGVTKNVRDIHDKEAGRLARHVQNLLENVILSRITNSPDLWRIGSKFYIWQGEYAKALDASVKAYRSIMHDTRLETDKEVFERVADVAMDTVEMYENFGDQANVDWKFQARNVLKGLIGKAKDSWEDTDTYEKLKERLAELRNQ